VGKRNRHTHSRRATGLRITAKDYVRRRKLFIHIYAHRYYDRGHIRLLMQPSTQRRLSAVTRVYRIKL